MKGGTTALHDNLRRHPKIKEGKEKEYHYYSLFYNKGRDWYESHFPKIKDSEYTVESSPTYFSETTSLLIPSLIKNDFPNGKLILILRDPVIRAISHFNHLVKINKIKELRKLDVNEFFDLDFSRAFSPTNTVYWHLERILKVSNYLWPLHYYNQIFDKSNLLILTNQELRKDPKSTMDKVYAYLNLEPIYKKRYSKIRYSHKSEKLKVNDSTLQKLQKYLYPSYNQLIKTQGLKVYDKVI